VQKKLFVGLLAVFVPPMAFLYLSRERLALIYLIALIVSVVGDYYLDLRYGMSGLGLILILVAIFHSLSLVKKGIVTEKKRFYNFWWGALAISLPIVLLIFSFRSFLYEPFSIPSESMAPTLNAGDYVVVSKLGYGSYGTWGVSLWNAKKPKVNPKAGEIFVLYPPNEERIFVQRIIGVPGDQISLNGPTLKINGEIVSESLDSTLVTESIGETVYTVKYMAAPFKYKNHVALVPAGHYFVMGDNRNNSLDGRFWGFVPEANIVGKVVLQW